MIYSPMAPQSARATSGGSASPTTFVPTGLTEGKHRIKFVLKDFGAIPDGLGISRFTTVAS